MLADQWIWGKKGTDRRICMPVFTPSLRQFTLISEVRSIYRTATELLSNLMRRRNVFLEQPSDSKSYCGFEVLLER